MQHDKLRGVGKGGCDRFRDTHWMRLRTHVLEKSKAMRREERGSKRFAIEANLAASGQKGSFLRCSHLRVLPPHSKQPLALP